MRLINSFALRSSRLWLAGQFEAPMTCPLLRSLITGGPPSGGRDAGSEGAEANESSLMSASVCWTTMVTSSSRMATACFKIE